MLSNLFDQIFGRSKCGKREVITTTIIETDSININDDDSRQLNESTNFTNVCYLPSFSLSCTKAATANEMNSSETNYESQPQQRKQLHDKQEHTTECCNQQQEHKLKNDNINTQQYHINNQNKIRLNQNKLNELSIFSVYLLFATLFVCICTIAALLFTYINRASDIIQLRDSLASEFIVRNDIDEIIRNVIRDMRNADDGHR